MKFRAELRDPSATRETKPEQSFSNSPSELEEWAIQTLARNQNPESAVVIFQTVEKSYRVISSQAAHNAMEQRAADKAAAELNSQRAQQLGLPPEAKP
jgi:hypothetical protein